MFYKFLLILGFFGNFYSPIGLLSYLTIFRVINVKFKLLDLVFIGYLILLAIYNLFFSDLYEFILTFRFYFGFIVFYICFRSGTNIPFEKIFIVLLIIIPIEAILINTIISAQFLPNFPTAAASSHFNLIGYQRPYSFGGNASVGGSILVILFFLFSYNKLTRLLTILNIALFSSGSGWLSYCLIYVIKWRKYLIFISPIFILLLFLVSFDRPEVNHFGSYKFSPYYILILLKMKLEMILFYFNDFSFVEYLFGNVSVLHDGAYGGDFGWIHFVRGYGFLSFFVYIYFILFNCNRYNAVPILILVIVTFHYPVMFFLPGQILLAYLLVLPNSKFNISKYTRDNH